MARWSATFWPDRPRLVSVRSRLLVSHLRLNLNRILNLNPVLLDPIGAVLSAGANLPQDCADSIDLVRRRRWEA